MTDVNFSCAERAFCFFGGEDEENWASSSPSTSFSVIVPVYWPWTLIGPVYKGFLIYPLCCCQLLNWRYCLREMGQVGFVVVIGIRPVMLPIHIPRWRDCISHVITHLFLFPVIFWFHKVSGSSPTPILFLTSLTDSQLMVVKFSFDVVILFYFELISVSVCGILTVLFWL